MLSDRDILAALEEGLLTITPFDTKQLRPAGITMQLGKEILIPQPVELIDLKGDQELEYDRVEITPEKPFVLQPQQFVLGHTEEVLSVGTKLGFTIEGRSTLARLGISVEQSSTIVDPGHHERPITLDLPATDTAAGISTAQAAILQAAADGELLPGEAATLAGILESRRKAYETQELESRITALEEKTK
jgi:deoxycytidine triphosphate deaminase